MQHWRVSAALPYLASPAPVKCGGLILESLLSSTDPAGGNEQSRLERQEYTYDEQIQKAVSRQNCWVMLAVLHKNFRV